MITNSQKTMILKAAMLSPTTFFYEHVPFFYLFLRFCQPLFSAFFVLMRAKKGPPIFRPAARCQHLKRFSIPLRLLLLCRTTTVAVRVR
jgi:hypothetical protein